MRISYRKGVWGFSVHSGFRDLSLSIISAAPILLVSPLTYFPLLSISPLDSISGPFTLPIVSIVNDCIRHPQ